MNLNSVPQKFFMKDLVNKPTPTEVWLQGTIEQTVGNDILIMSDSSGRSKIVKCESADGLINKDSIKKGTYCCIIGTAVKTKGLPEIEARKFIDLSSQPQIKSVWDLEVKEAQLFLKDQIRPTI